MMALVQFNSPNGTHCSGFCQDNGSKRKGTLKQFQKLLVPIRLNQLPNPICIFASEFMLKIEMTRKWHMIVKCATLVIGD